MAEVGTPERSPHSRAAGAYLVVFGAVVVIYAILRGAGRIVVPLVGAIVLGIVIARWLRSWWTPDRRR